MVNKHILQLNFISALLLLSNICFSSPQLLLFIDKTESELGRPIRVELYAVSLKEKLSEINLKPLNKHFGVITEYSTADTRDSRWPKQTLQTLNVKLYPRQAGNIVIPKLSIGKFQSKEKNIKVFKGEMGLPKLVVSSINPYERQQFTIKVMLPSSQLSSRLSISEDERINGFDSSPLSFKRIKQNDGTYLLQIGWTMSALSSGNKKIEFPAIEYTISGVSRKKYYLPIQELNIKKLPSYLPPTIPVGKVILQSQLSETGLLKTDSIIYWNLKIKGDFSNSYQLPPILRQIKSNNEVKFFPVNSKRLNQITDNSIISSITHSIPLKIVKSGFIKLPALQLQYFDPDNGKIKPVTFQDKQLFVLSSFWLSVLGILLTSLSVYIAWVSYSKWNQFKYISLKRKQALELLQKQLTTEDIRESIRLLSDAEYWPKNISLKQWKEHWSKKYITDSNFYPFMKDISQTCYGNYIDKEDKINDIKDISNKLMDIINNRTRNKTRFNYFMLRRNAIEKKEYK